MLVRDVMQRDPVVCAADVMLDQVAKLMMQFDCRAITVINLAEHPVGVVTDRDIIRRIVAQGKNPLAYPIQHCMSCPVVTVSADEPVDNVIAMMHMRRIRQVPVVDEDGRCIGLVSDTDVGR